MIDNDVDISQKIPSTNFKEMFPVVLYNTMKHIYYIPSDTHAHVRVCVRYILSIILKIMCPYNINISLNVTILLLLCFVEFPPIMFASKCCR